jgi:hypothetical protein
MSDLDNIISITVSASSLTLTRPGFSTMAIAVYHTKYVDRVRTYSSPQDVLADGFTVNEAGYRAVASAFKQNPRLKQVKMIRLTTAVAHTVELTPATFSAGETLSLTMVDSQGVEYPISRLVPGSSTLTAEVTALANLIDPVADITAVNTGGIKVTATGGTAGKLWWFKNLKNIQIKDITPDASIDTDLAAALAVDTDWYGLVWTIESKANSDKAVSWAQANGKFAMVHSADDIEAATGGSLIGAAYKAAADDHAYGIWSRDTINYPAAAHLGRQLAVNPGSSKYNDKTLIGVTVDVLTPTQKTALETAGWNYYINIGNLPATRKEGKVFSGEYADIITGTDWMKVEAQSRGYEVIRADEKLSYTDAGLQKLAGALRGVMKLASGPQYNLLDPGNPDAGIDPPAVTMPLVSDIDITSRKNRNVPGVQMSARFQGAVNSAGITMTLTF